MNKTLLMDLIEKVRKFREEVDTFISSNKNKTSRQRVKEILGKDPLRSYQSIADQIGISRERVRQIAMALGFPKRNTRIVIKKCLGCGIDFLPRNNGVKYHSSSCFQHVRHLKSMVVLTCEECDIKFLRRACVVRWAETKGYKHVRCSRTCQGKFIGKNHGSRTNLSKSRGKQYITS